MTDEPIAGAAISIGSARFVTDEAGRFEGPRMESGIQSVTVTGDSIVNRVTYANVDAGDIAVDVIQEKPPFDLAFFRRLVRNGFEAPEVLAPIRRLTEPLKVYIKTVDEAGVPMDDATLRPRRTSCANRRLRGLVDGLGSMSLNSGPTHASDRLAG